MVGCEHIRGLAVIAIKLAQLLRNLLDAIIHNPDVVQIEFRGGEVGVTVGVQAKQMQEKHNLIRVQLLVQCLVRLGLFQQQSEFFEYPGVQHACIA